MEFPFSQPTFVFAVISALLIGGTTSAAAAESPDIRGTIPTELKIAARQLLAILDSVGQTQIEFGAFVPMDPGSQANGGPGLQIELRSALDQLRKGVVTDKANLVVSGKFRRIDDPQDSPRPGESPKDRFLVERLTLEPFDKKSKTIVKTIDVDIRRLRDIARIDGIILAVDPDADAREQNQTLRKEVEKPSQNKARIVDGKRIVSHPGSPYALTVVASPKDAPSAAGTVLNASLDDSGMPRVSIDKGQCYELLFSNDSSEEAAISVRIDGIDVFQFSSDRDPNTNRPLFGHFIVGPKSSTTVYGWYKSGAASQSANFQRFLVTEYGQGASSQSRVPAVGNIGVITVAVSKSRGLIGTRVRGGAETGFGPPVTVNVQRVEREIDPPHDFIAVRYLR